MMFSDNVASAIRGKRPTPLANFKEGEGDPYIYSERQWAKWEANSPRSLPL